MTAQRARRMALLPGLVLGGAAGGQLVSLVTEQRWVPVSIQFGQAIVYGAFIALTAVGLVLVWRASRVVNFAIGGFAAAATMLYLLLRSSQGWSFWLAVPAAIGAALVAGVVVEVLIVRRFTNAPRLVLTVATIALGQILAGVTLSLPRWFGIELDADAIGGGGPGGGGGGDLGAGFGPELLETPTTPFEGFERDWAPWFFDGDDILTVAVVAVLLLGLALFFRYTSAGVAIKAAAENVRRAALLGIETANLSTLVWTISSTLAAVGGLLGGFITDASVASQLGVGIGGGLAASIGTTGLLRGLTAAVIARMESIPIAVAASIGVAILDRSVFLATGQTALTDLALLLAIVVALLSQRARSGRLETTVASSWEAIEEIRGIPAELASLPQVRLGVRRVLWVGAAVLLVYPWVMSPSQTSLGAVYAIYGMVGISLVVLTGWAGQISLGQFGLVAVGALVGGALSGTVGLPFPVAVVAGTIAAGLVAVIVGLPALRIQGLFLAVTTIAFAVVTQNVLLNDRYFSWLIPVEVNRPKFASIDTSTDERAFYYLCILSLMLIVFVATSLRRTRLGRILIAARDNEQTAQAFGVSLVRTRITAFAVSGLIAGFAGALFVHQQASFSVAAFGPEQSTQIFLMAVLGGMGNVYTVLVGALYLATVEFAIPFGWARLLSSGGGVLAIMILFPQGLGAFFYRLRDAWLRRVALRNRIHVPALMGDREGAAERVRLGERLETLDPVAGRYRLPSEIGTTGRSQLASVWKDGR